MEEQNTHLQVDVLEVGNRDHGAVLRLSGEVDMTTASRLETTFQELADRQLTEVIVDASTVTFMDSTDLHALVKGKQLIHEVGSNLALWLPLRFGVSSNSSFPSPCSLPGLTRWNKPETPSAGLKALLRPRRSCRLPLSGLHPSGR